MEGRCTVCHETESGIFAPFRFMPRTNFLVNLLFHGLDFTGSKISPVLSSIRCQSPILFRISRSNFLLTASFAFLLICSPFTYS